MKKIGLIVVLLLCSHALFAESRITQKSLKDVAIYPEVVIPASTESLNDAKISAEVRANVKKIPVLVGETVKRGEVLVQLDDKDYKLNLHRAEVALKGIESRLKLADYQLDQAKALIKDKAITDELLRQRQAEVTTLQAEREAQLVAVDIAKQDLKKTVIRAPYTAVIAERIAQVGELANPGTPLVRVVDISRIEVSAKIQPQDVRSLEKAGKFQFTTLERSYNLELRKLSPLIDPIQRNREARLVFKDEMALPGSSGTLIWKQTIPHVPANLIVRRNNKLGIFINNKGHAKFIQLQGATEGRPSSVDLAMNSNIIIDGRYSVQDGDVVITE